MKKYICLRDDDTSFITKPEEIFQVRMIVIGMCCL